MLNALPSYEVQSAGLPVLLPPYLELTTRDARRDRAWVNKEWQERHGLIGHGFRLHPKVPFVFGGGYGDDNLHAERMTVIIAFRTEIARQIEDIPDGTRIMIDTDR